MVDAAARLGAAAARRRGLIVSERRLLLTALDLVAVAVAVVVAFNLHSASVRNGGFSVPVSGIVATTAAWLVCARLVGAHDLRASHDARSTVRAVTTTLGGSLLVLLGLFFVVPYSLTRPTILLWAPLTWLLVLSGRLVFTRVVGSSTFAGRVGVVLTSAGRRQVWPEVEANLGSMYEVVAFVDPERPDAVRRLHRLVEERGVDQIILGVRDEMSRELFRAVLACHEQGVVVRSLAEMYEELTGRLLLDQLGHTWLTALPMRSETSRLYSAFKRSVDVAAALAALALLAAVIVPAALAIRLADGGPVFHRQLRVGKYGRPFPLWKLRTMRVVTATTWTADRDPRITRPGRWLRRLHLDELPQAWSILRGDMSIIGPRPEQPQYVRMLREQIDFYNTRLTVRPGLTGWAQVNYGYGSGVEGARAKLSYDLYYVKRQSASLDLVILGRTLVHVLSAGGL